MRAKVAGKIVDFCYGFPIVKKMIIRSSSPVEEIHQFWPNAWQADSYGLRLVGFPMVQIRPFYTGINGIRDFFGIPVFQAIFLTVYQEI